MSFLLLSRMPATIDAHEKFDGKLGPDFAHAFKGAGDAALHEQAGFGEVEPDDPIDLAVPVCDSVLGQLLAGFEADAVVVDAEVGGVRVRDIDGDERNAGAGDLVSDDGRDLVLDLELDDQIDLVLDELFGVRTAVAAVVAVVEDQQVDADSVAAALQALGDLDGERHLGALAAEAEAQLLGAGDVAVGAVRGLREIAAMHEGLEHAIDGGLRDAGLAMNGLERHRLIFALQQLEDVERLGQDRDQIEPLGCLARCHVHLPGSSLSMHHYPIKLQCFPNES